MNKKIVFLVMLTCFLIVKTNVSLFAQATGNDQRLIGTWVGLHRTNASITFNANGTMTVVNSTFDGFVPTHWAAAGDRLLVFIPDMNPQRRAIRYFHMSTDGRTLITSTIAVEGAGGRGSIGSAWRRN